MPIDKINLIYHKTFIISNLPMKIARLNRQTILKTPNQASERYQIRVTRNEQNPQRATLFREPGSETTYTAIEPRLLKIISVVCTRSESG